MMTTMMIMVAVVGGRARRRRDEDNVTIDAGAPPRPPSLPRVCVVCLCVVSEGLLATICMPTRTLCACGRQTMAPRARAFIVSCVFRVVPASLVLWSVCVRVSKQAKLGPSIAHRRRVVARLEGPRRRQFTARAACKFSEEISFLIGHLFFYYCSGR